MRMHLPSALSPGQTDRAMVSFTTTTGAPCSSAGGELAPLDDPDAEDVEELRRRRLQERKLAAGARRLRPAGHGDRRDVEARERNRAQSSSRRARQAPRARARAPRRTDRRGWRRRVPARRRRRRRCPCSCRSPARAGCRDSGRTCRRRRAAAPTARSGGRAVRSATRRPPAALALAVEASRGELPRADSTRWRSPSRSRRGRPAQAAASSVVRPAPSPAATSGSSTCLIAPSNHDASSSDTPVAAIETTAASTNACWSSRPRVAPSAARMANSRRRRDARTSSSVAALARPMTSTRADTPVSHQATRRSTLETSAPPSGVSTTRAVRRDACLRRRRGRRRHRARAWPRSPRSADTAAGPSRVTGASRRRTAPTSRRSRRNGR